MSMSMLTYVDIDGKVANLYIFLKRTNTGWMSCPASNGGPSSWNRVTSLGLNSRTLVPRPFGTDVLNSSDTRMASVSLQAARVGRIGSTFLAVLRWQKMANGSVSWIIKVESR